VPKRFPSAALGLVLFLCLSQCGGDLPEGFSEQDGQLVLNVTDAIQLPVSFSRDFGSLSTEGESELKFRIENSRATPIGTGSIALNSGVASICSCDGGALTLGQLSQGGCLKVKISLDASVSGSQQARLEFLGIVNIELSGEISARRVTSNRNLTVGGDCGF
jgi:hypothetical protein